MIKEYKKILIDFIKTKYSVTKMISFLSNRLITPKKGRIPRK